MSSARQKKRSPNFTKQEETLLVSLVKEYKGVLECKKSGQITWKKKQDIWVKIQGIFNANSQGEFRDLDTIKQKYQNFKKSAKQKCSHNKKGLNQTGGGRYKMIELDDVDLSIKEIIGEEMDGLPSVADSDFSVAQDAAVLENEVEEIIPDNSSAELIESKQTTQMEQRDWGTYCPSMLKEPINIKLNVNRGIFDNCASSSNQESNSQCAEPNKELTCKNVKSRKPLAVERELNKKLILEKLEFLKLQRELLLKEHSLKMEILKYDLEIKKQEAKDKLQNPKE